MKKIVSVFVFVLLALVGFAQNLVPNPSFELYDTCPDYAAQLQRALYWTNPSNASPDYYNECALNYYCDIPSNSAGYQYARTGVAYAGIITALHDSVIQPGQNNYREYIQCQLLDTLRQGSKYCITFYVSAGDSVNYVSNNIGVYFSPTQIYQPCTYCTLPYTPQFENPILNDLSDRLGWTEVGGIYTASGGEKYMIIGNFRDSANTTITHTGWNSSNAQSSTYFYIDDVGLVNCDSGNTVSELVTNDKITLSPNPSDGLYFIKGGNIYTGEIEIYNSIGEIIRRQHYESTNTVIDLTNEANGIYHLILKTNSKQYQIKIIKN